MILHDTTLIIYGISYEHSGNLINFEQVFVSRNIPVDGINKGVNFIRRICKR